MKMKKFFPIIFLFVFLFFGCVQEKILNKEGFANNLSESELKESKVFFDAVKNSDEGKKLVSVYGDKLAFAIDDASGLKCSGIQARAEAWEKVQKDYAECKKKYADWKTVRVEDQDSEKALVDMIFTFNDKKEIVEIYDSINSKFLKEENPEN